MPRLRLLMLTYPPSSSHAVIYLPSFRPPLMIDPSTALSDWPARQILRSHLLFLFPLQPRTNGLLTIFFFNLVFFALCTLHKQILYFTIYIPPSPPPCLFDTLTVPVAFFFWIGGCYSYLHHARFFPLRCTFFFWGACRFSPLQASAMRVLFTFILYIFLSVRRIYHITSRLFSPPPTLGPSMAIYVVDNPPTDTYIFILNPKRIFSFALFQLVHPDQFQFSVLCGLYIFAGCAR